MNAIIFPGKECGAPNISYAHPTYLLNESGILNDVSYKYSTVINATCPFGFRWNSSTYGNHSLPITCTDSEIWSTLSATCVGN